MIALVHFPVLIDVYLPSPTDVSTITRAEFRLEPVIAHVRREQLLERALLGQRVGSDDSIIVQVPARDINDRAIAASTLPATCGKHCGDGGQTEHHHERNQHTLA